MVSMGGRSNNGIVVRLGGEKGADVTKTHTLSEGKSLACIMTPNRYDGHTYAISKGIASCADAKQVNKFIKNVCLASENRSNAVAPAITTSPRCRRRKTLSVHQKRGSYVVDAPPPNSNCWPATAWQKTARNLTPHQQSQTENCLSVPTAGCTASGPADLQTQFDSPEFRPATSEVNKIPAPSPQTPT